MNASFEIRKATQSHASESPSASEGRTPEQLDQTKNTQLGNSCKN
jgi:hypothetical protein